MFKIDENYSDYYDDTDVVRYPGGKAINSSGVDTTDGTPWLAKMFNNTIGWMQALVIKVYGNLNGISSEPENVQRSDIVNALEKMRTDNNAAERTISDGKYLPFSGGTVTGNLAVTGETDLKKTTVDGDLQVNGNITESGEAYETHAEQIYTKSDLIVSRDGAVAALSPEEYSGILVRKADGTNDVAIAVDSDGNARVGNYELVIVYSENGTHFFSDPELTNPVTIPAGITPRPLAGVANRYYYAGTDDTQPIATREEESSMSDGYGVTWNATKKCLETTFIPSGAVIPTNIAGDTTVQSVVADRCFYFTASSGCTLTLGNGAQVGIKVRIINTTSLTHTLSCTSVSVNVPHILPMANIEIMWNGTAWQNISGEAVGSTWVQRSQQENPFDVFPCSAWTELVNRNGAFERSENAPTTIYSLDGTTFYADVERERPIDISGLGNATDTGNTVYNSRGELMKIYSGSWTGGNIGIGSTGGAPTVTLSEANMPEHYHTTSIGSTSGSFSGETGEAGSHSGSITTRSAWDGSVIPAQFFGSGVFSANNNWGAPNARTSYESAWQGDGRCSTITLSVGDHKHSISGSISVDFGTKDTDKKGSGTAFSIIPPYIGTRIWKRTA